MQDDKKYSDKSTSHWKFLSDHINQRSGGIGRIKESIDRIYNN